MSRRAPRAIKWYRGLPYEAGVPIDRVDEAGRLARPVVLGGIELPAGTTVGRDVDFEYVWAELAEPIEIDGVALPPGTRLDLYRVVPRAWWEWPLRAVLVWPLIAPSIVLSWLRSPSQDPAAPSLGDRSEAPEEPGVIWLKDRAVRAVLPP